MTDSEQEWADSAERVLIGRIIGDRRVQGEPPDAWNMAFGAAYNAWALSTGLTIDPKVDDVRYMAACGAQSYADGRPLPGNDLGDLVYGDMIIKVSASTLTSGGLFGTMRKTAESRTAQEKTEGEAEVAEREQVEKILDSMPEGGCLWSDSGFLLIEKNPKLEAKEDEEYRHLSGLLHGADNPVETFVGREFILKRLGAYKPSEVEKVRPYTREEFKKEVARRQERDQEKLKDIKYDKETGQVTKTKEKTTTTANKNGKSGGTTKPKRDPVAPTKGLKAERGTIKDRDALLEVCGKDRWGKTSPTLATADQLVEPGMYEVGNNFAIKVTKKNGTVEFQPTYKGKVIKSYKDHAPALVGKVFKSVLNKKNAESRGLQVTRHDGGITVKPADKIAGKN